MRRKVKARARVQHRVRQLISGQEKIGSQRFCDLIMNLDIDPSVSIQWRVSIY